MPPQDTLQLPFLTRKMLSFEQAVTFALRIDMQSDTAAKLAIRGMTREGMFTYSATTAANSLITQATFALPDIPIYITIEDVARVLQQGNTFITISLMANGNVIQQLTSGYIYGQKALSWPNTQQVDLRPGGGLITSATGANPAPGNDATIVVPANEIWRIISVSVAFTTSATVANRRVMVSFEPGALPSINCWAMLDQTASQIRTYRIAKYGVDRNESIDSTQLVNMPSEVWIDTTGQVRITATNLAVNDDFGTATVSFEKFYATV